MKQVGRDVCLGEVRYVVKLIEILVYKTFTEAYDVVNYKKR